METSLVFAAVGAVSFIYSEATHSLSKEFSEPRARKMVEATQQDASQTLCILYSPHHETYGTIHLGSHPPLW